MKHYLKQIEQRARISPYLAIPTTLLVFCVMGGSSAQNPVFLSLLFLGAACICAAVCISWHPRCQNENLFLILSFFAAIVTIGLVQLIPFPIWWIKSLPGREMIYADWELLGLIDNYTSISLVPENTVSALFSLIIPLAAILAVYRLGWQQSTRFLPWTIVLCGVASVVLGFAQVLLDQSGELYLYQHTSKGLPAGFFANVNHQANFLLMTLPFTAYIFREARLERLTGEEAISRWLILGSILAVQIVGILAAGSVAGYLLLLPILPLSYRMAFVKGTSFSGRSIGLAAGMLIISVIVVATSPVLEGIGYTSLSDGETSRLGIYKTSLDVLSDHMIIGSGLGSFQQVYNLYENADIVGLSYVNFAHNDFLQWFIELGIPGALLLMAALFLITRRIAQIWITMSDSSTLLRRAASIALLAPALHSLVDYPARTPSILFTIGVLITLLYLPPPPSDSKKHRSRNSHKSVTL